jgi:small subunit ribosomal protein S17
MEKTAVVEVKRRWRHPLYRKVLETGKKYLAHDEKGVEEGDIVIIEECRPISKRKHFKVIKKVR